MLELKVSKFLMEIWFEVEFENHEHVISVTSFNQLIRLSILP